MEARASIGLPASRSHVEQLLTDPDAEMIEGYGPCTEQEARYVRLRDADDMLDAGLAYLQNHEADLYVGDEIADDWPNDPYTRIFITGDLDRLQREIALRDSGRFRLERVPRSLRELRALTDRIDSCRLREQGIHVYRKAPDLQRGRVSVSAGSNRTDTLQIVRQLYGELVDVIVTPHQRGFHCTRVQSFNVVDAQHLTLHYLTGPAPRFEYVAVEETPTAVVVAIVESVLPGPKRRAGVQRQAYVALRSPLEQRAVLDAISGVKLSAAPPSRRPARRND